MRNPLNAEDAALAVEVAERVRAEMRRQRITQAALARTLGWKPLPTARRVNPKIAQFTEMTALELWHVATALGQPVSAFLPPVPETRPVGECANLADAARGE